MVPALWRRITNKRLIMAQQEAQGDVNPRVPVGLAVARAGIDAADPIFSRCVAGSGHQLIDHQLPRPVERVDGRRAVIEVVRPENTRRSGVSKNIRISHRFAAAGECPEPLTVRTCSCIMELYNHAV